MVRIAKCKCGSGTMRKQPAPHLDHPLGGRKMVEMVEMVEMDGMGAPGPHLYHPWGA